MTTFQDGPANGQNLMLHRAVRFLRVVHDGTKWDALDQPDDTPAANETLYAYEIVGEPAMCHINRGGGRGGFYAIANYKLCNNQPEDSKMRSKTKWVDWCMKQAK